MIVYYNQIYGGHVQIFSYCISFFYLLTFSYDYFSLASHSTSFYHHFHVRSGNYRGEFLYCAYFGDILGYCKCHFEADIAFVYVAGKYSYTWIVYIRNQRVSLLAPFDVYQGVLCGEFLVCDFGGIPPFARFVGDKRAVEKIT